MSIVGVLAAVFRGLDAFLADSDKFSIHVHERGEVTADCLATGERKYHLNSMMPDACYYCHMSNIACSTAVSHTQC